VYLGSEEEAEDRVVHASTQVFSAREIMDIKAAASYLGVYVAQQQCTSTASAIKGVDDPGCDAWLMVAELAMLAHESRIGQFLGDQAVNDQFARTYRAICCGQRSCGSLPFRVGEAGANAGGAAPKALEADFATRFEKSPLCSSIETTSGRSGD
jgi:hypothetical protein